MSLPETIVAWRTSLGLQWWKPTEEWTQENEDFHADRRFYCASSVASQLAIESTQRELKLAELELEVESMKGTFTAQKAKRVEICRKAGKARAEKAVRGKNGRFVKACERIGGLRQVMNAIPDRQYDSAPVAESSATPLRRYIPERPWHWHLWMWLKVEVWEKFVLGRQS